MEHVGPPLTHQIYVVTTFIAMHVLAAAVGGIILFTFAVITSYIFTTLLWPLKFAYDHWPRRKAFAPKKYAPLLLPAGQPLTMLMPAPAPEVPKGDLSSWLSRMIGQDNGDTAYNRAKDEIRQRIAQNLGVDLKELIASS